MNSRPNSVRRLMPSTVSRFMGVGLVLFITVFTSSCGTGTRPNPLETVDITVAKGAEVSTGDIGFNCEHFPVEINWDCDDPSGNGNGPIVPIDGTADLPKKHSYADAGKYAVRCRLKQEAAGGWSDPYALVEVVDLEVKVELTVATGGNTTNTAPGPNSRGVLGLWNAKVGDNFDMRIKCANHTTGDTVNGGVSWTMAGHPYLVGTGLKTEMYGHITDRGGLEDAVIENNANWQIRQSCRGWTKQNEHKVVNKPTWEADGTPRVTTSGDAEFDLPNDYLYAEDCPKIAQLTPAEGENGDTVSADWDYHTSVWFKYDGEWTRVSDVEHWGYTAKMLKVEGVWTVLQQAQAK